MLALTRDTYSRGSSRKSVTQLIDSPRVHALRGKHDHEITVDVSDRLWALMGRAVHTVLEMGDDEHLTEERLFIDVEGWTISGAVDLQKVGDDVLIADYKLTSAYNVVNEKPDWTRQLNLYAHLVEEVKGVRVAGLEIIAIVRDWNRREAERNSDYPQTPIHRVKIALWSREERAAYLKERVRLHQDAEIAIALGDDPPLCTDEEKWMRPTKWAVQKPGAARATKVFDTQEEADAFAAEKKGLEVQERPGEAIRCAGNYCQVAAFCSQRKV